MTRSTKGIVAAAIALALVGGAAAAILPPGPYKTDAQAQVFLETKLKRWAGINLAAVDFKYAFCLNGYYSKVEKRTGRHYPQGRTNRYGENIFRSFACTMGAGNRSFNLYLATRVKSLRFPQGWLVMADR